MYVYIYIHTCNKYCLHIVQYVHSYLYPEISGNQERKTSQLRFRLEGLLSGDRIIMKMKLDMHILGMKIDMQMMKSMPETKVTNG